MQLFVSSVDQICSYPEGTSPQSNSVQFNAGRWNGLNKKMVLV